MSTVSLWIVMLYITFGKSRRGCAYSIIFVENPFGETEKKQKQSQKSKLLSDFIFVWIDLQHDLESDLESDLLWDPFSLLLAGLKGKRDGRGFHYCERRPCQSKEERERGKKRKIRV